MSHNEEHEMRALFSNLFSDPERGLTAGMSVKYSVFAGPPGEDGLPELAAIVYVSNDPWHFTLSVSVEGANNTTDTKHLVFDWGSLVEMIKEKGTPDELIEASAQMENVDGVEDLLRLMKEHGEDQ